MMGKIRIHKLIRSRRRTICLTIDQNAQVVIKAPILTPMRYIEDFVNKKQSWIAKKIAEIKSRPTAKPKSFENGEEFLYLGQKYNLRIAPTKTPVQLKDELVVSTNIWPKHKEAIEKWYKKQAQKIIEERCAGYSKILNCKPKNIKISNANRRWGSCSAKGNLRFSWRLIMAPLAVLDYVVVHELSHLHELNHSRHFWAKVKSILPDYKKRQQWLKKHEALLSL